MGALDFLSPITGSKPQIADYEPIDLSEEQLKAITANIENFPQFEQLGNLYQQFMLSQYESAIPGFRDILAMGGETTKQMLGVSKEYLAGEIPKDVQEAVQRSSAFQSLMGGTAGSGMSRALTARDFGLTSMNLIQQGAGLAGQAGNAAQRWASLAQAGGPQGILVSTEQQKNLDMQQALIKQATQQTKYNVAAAPDPGWKHLSDIVYGLTAAYLGGGRGGGGGLPAGNAAATDAAGPSAAVNYAYQNPSSAPENTGQGYGLSSFGTQAYPQQASMNFGGMYPTASGAGGGLPYNYSDTLAYQSNFPT